MHARMTNVCAVSLNPVAGGEPRACLGVRLLGNLPLQQLVEPGRLVFNPRRRIQGGNVKFSLCFDQSPSTELVSYLFNF